MYDGIVLSGGGMKGFLQLGFIDSLLENKKIDKLKYFAGCSIGSILCVLLIVGYTPQELITYFCTNDVCSLFKGFNILLISNHYGLIDSKIILEYIETMVMLKLNYIPTFKDIYIKQGKIFICPSYKLNYSNEENPHTYFSYKTHPNMHITKAACCSSNIPIIFTKIEHEGGYYVDGGLFDNFPVNRLLKEIQEDPWTNEYYSIIAIKFEHDLKQLEINSFSDYVKHLFTAATKNKNLIQNDNVTIINIKTALSAIDFDIDTKRKLDLFIEGKKYYKK